MSGLRWRLCAVRCEGPDQAGRLVTAEVVPLSLGKLGQVSKALGGVGTFEGAILLAESANDSREIRLALGLPPRDEVSLGGESGLTGVAGVMS